MNKLRLLFCDDSAGVQKGFELNVGKILESTLEVVYASSVDGVRELIEDGEEFDILVTDLNFAKVGGGTKDGIEIIRIAKEHWPDVEPILLTAYEGSLDVRDGMKLQSLGLTDGALMQKTDAEDPGVTWLRLRERIQGIAMLRGSEASRTRRLKREVRHLREVVAVDTLDWAATRDIPEAARTIRTDRGFCFHGMVGRSFAMQDVFRRIERAARLPSDVLILGPTGVGKDLVAQAIHKLSERASKPFVKVDLTTISEKLVESELFGHEKGSFTGADQKKDGLFKAAEGGSFFLDEIGNVPLEVQAKLLRVLEERRFRPVGATRDLEADVRVIAATNADLEMLAREEKFREDLYERLNVVRILVPSLTHRREDIPLQVIHFLDQFRQRFGFLALQRIERDALELFMSCEWPRNVRQLRHAVERLFAEIDPASSVVDRAAVERVLEKPKDGPPVNADAGSVFREIQQGRLSVPLAEVKKRYGEIVVRDIIRRTMIHFSGMPDGEDCAKWFGGMTANAWRQFAFQLGLTWKAVRDSLA